MHFKRKEKFDKFSIRGLIYMSVAAVGMSYELIFAAKIRPLLIVGYSVVIFIGMLCLFFIGEIE